MQACRHRREISQPARKLSQRVSEYYCPSFWLPHTGFCGPSLYFSPTHHRLCFFSFFFLFPQSYLSDFIVILSHPSKCLPSRRKLIPLSITLLILPLYPSIALFSVSLVLLGGPQGTCFLDPHQPLIAILRLTN